jgi:hypothetical protein
MRTTTAKYKFRKTCGETLDATAAGVKLAPAGRRLLMKFFINACDTAGKVTLQRDTVPAAMKKAVELMSDGCWDVEVIMPDGAVYQPGEFEQLRERAGIA